MNKEEAKKEFSKWCKDNNFPEQSLFTHEVKNLIDSIELKYAKVVLPKEVGEQWDKLVSYNSTIAQPGNELDSALVDIITSCPDQDTEALYGWLADTWNAYSKLIDAARYGWVPEEEKSEKEKSEKEKRWNVFVPAAIKVPGHVSLYEKFKYGVQPINTDGPINSGEFSFTQEELFNYGLDSPLYEKQVVNYGK